MASDRAQILITAIDQTRQAFASVKANLEGLSNVAGKINGVLAGLGTALSVAGLMAASKAAIDTADGLDELTQKTGVSVEALSTLQRVAEHEGITVDAFATALRKLSGAMVEAAGGAKAQGDTFSRLGVSVRDIADQLRPTEDVLLDLAEAFAAMPDGAEKSALAVKIFGKTGTDLIPFLNMGRVGIEQLRAKFRELGLEISGGTAAAAAKFNDALFLVSEALQGITMKVAEAALPALQKLTDTLVTLASHGEEIMTAVRVLGEVLVAVLAVKGIAAVAALGGALAALKAAFTRFLPVLAAVAVWEMGKGLVETVQDIRQTNRAIDEMGRRREQLRQLSAAMEELANTGTVSVKTQMALAALAVERLQAALPGTADALRASQGAATQAGEAIRQALDAETKKAAETAKQLTASYKQVAADIKTIWDARAAEIESHYRRQEAAAQNAARSESVGIRESTQGLLAAEREKRAAVEASARQIEAARQATYGQAVALARSAGQDVAAIEHQAVEARVSLYSQLESAYRATVDRLIAEEQRHLNAARSAEAARLALKMSVEDRIRELGRKGLDEYAAYQDRQRQIDEKQAQAKAALAAGNYEQARKLAEESMQLAEGTASAVTRQVEQNGKTITETLVSEGAAAKRAISQIEESASIADTALKGVGDAHKQAAAAAGTGADETRRALTGVSDALGELQSQLLAQDKLKLEVDIEGARAGIEKLKALTEAQQLVAMIQVDIQQAESSLERLKSDTGNLALVAKVEADTTKVLADIDTLKGALSAARVEIPALVAFDQPRAQLTAFVQEVQTALSQPTQATHTPTPNLALYNAAVSQLQRPTSSTHTVYVRQVQANAQDGLIQRFAEGGRALQGAFSRLSGMISGPGTETSDSIPALLSQGEFVIRAASVRRFGAAFFAALNAGFLPPLPRLALGGAVSRSLAGALSPRSTAVAPVRDSVDLRFHIGGQTHSVQSSRETAMQLAQALRELSRGA